MSEGTHFGSAYVPHHASELDPTPLSRFFRKVTKLFSSKARLGPFKLSGRIRELHNTSEGMLRDLKAFRSRLEKKAERPLFSMASGLIDPIVKEMTRLQKAMDKKTSATHQVKAVSKYVELIEKARIWVEVAATGEDLHLISHVIIMQTAQEFEWRIARDAQVIHDYLNHATDNFLVSEAAKVELKKKMRPILAPIMKKLYALKDLPPDITIDSLASWRSMADEQRERFFTEALHAVDNFFMEYPTLTPMDSGSNILKELRQQL